MDTIKVEDTELSIAGDMIDKTTIGTIQVTLGLYKAGGNREWFVSLMDFHGIRFNITGVFNAEDGAKIHYTDMVNAVRLDALPPEIWDISYRRDWGVSGEQEHIAITTTVGNT